MIQQRIGIRKLLPTSIVYSDMPGEDGTKEIIDLMGNLPGLGKGYIRRLGTPEEYIRVYRSPLEWVLKNRDIRKGSQVHYEEVVKAKRAIDNLPPSSDLDTSLNL